MHDLPYYSKFLLCAAYLSSYNPARQDSLFFMRASDLTKKKRRGGGRGRPAKNRKVCTGEIIVYPRCQNLCQLKSHPTRSTEGSWVRKHGLLNACLPYFMLFFHIQSLPRLIYKPKSVLILRPTFTNANADQNPKNRSQLLHHLDSSPKPRPQTRWRHRPNGVSTLAGITSGVWRGMSNLILKTLLPSRLGRVLERCLQMSNDALG